MSESWSSGRMLQEIWKEVRGLATKEEVRGLATKNEVRGLAATLDKVKNDTTVIKGQVIQINSRLDGVEGDIRDVKDDIAGLKKDIESGEDWKEDRE